MALSKENKVIVKELIEMNSKVQKLRSWQDKFDFIEATLKNIVKAAIATGMLVAYYKGDMMMLLLLIGVAILTLGYWNKIE